MKRAMLAALGLALLAGAGPAAEDGRLKHAVEFRDGQGGFAGVTGTLWKVEPDGTWVVATFLNDREQKVLRKGKLGEKQLAALAAHLAALQVAKLPAEMGGFRGANPHTFVLRVGDRTTTVTVAAGQSLTETVLAGEQAEPWSRLVAAAAILQRWTAGEGPEGPRPPQGK